MGKITLPVQTLPAIVKLLGQTEEAIFRITGVHVKLAITVNNVPIGHEDGAWLLLQEIICAATGLTWHQIASTSRQRKLVVARQAYCWFGRNRLGGRSLKTIGHDLGGMDHTSIINAIRKYDGLLNVNDDLAKKLFNEINQRMQYEDKIDQAGI